MTEGKMVGWHHRLNEYEFEQVLGVGNGQGDLACSSAWGCKESDSTEQAHTHTHISFQFSSVQSLSRI